MKTRRAFGWVAATTLAAALLVSLTWWKQGNQAIPQPAAEPNLFPFLKALDATSLDSGGNATAADASDGDAAANKEIAQGKPPEDARDQLFALASIFNTEQSVHTLRAQGASDDDIYRTRAAALSAEAAARLADRERAETAWNSRITAYLAERDKLLDRQGYVSGMDRTPALQRLRDTHFTFEEQAQLAAYESSKVPQLTFKPF